MEDAINLRTASLQSGTVGLLYHCQRSVKARSSPLSSFTFFLWQEVQLWLTLTTAGRISPKLRTLHFLFTAKEICAYGWRVEPQSGAAVSNCRWQTPDLSPPDGVLSANSTHIAFVCREIAKPKAFVDPLGLPAHPFPPTSAQMWAKFQTHTANILIEHL